MCSARTTLIGLPGRHYDKTPRHFREKFLSGEVDLMGFVKDNFWGRPKTRDARFENKIKAYATASIAIDLFWNYVKEQSFKEVLAGLKPKHGCGPHEERGCAMNLI